MKNNQSTKIGQSNQEEDDMNFSDPESEDEDQDSSDDDLISNNNSFLLQNMQSSSLLTTMREAPKYIIPSSDFLKMQKDITSQTRLAVVDWIFRVIDRVRYSREAFFNSVAILDHMLASTTLTKQNIQLYAATCLWMTAKLYETKNRELTIFTAVCRDQFKQEDFISTEMNIISALNGRIEYPTPQTFIRALLIDTDLIDCEEMCNFFLDVSVTVNDFEELPAHFVSAAAIIIGSAACDKFCPISKLMALINCSCQTSLLKAAQALLNIASSVVEKNLGGIFAFYAKDSPDRLSVAITKATDYIHKAGI
ncbi:hypothetical protein M9Y10_033854 [Tritrichomonas musculus]|uniref:Cyclin-like domain-containing protein n=1 Tax=Tritrichomonas musculus TaxID=1915356 RepID=A0ABR2KD95_9EUKA